MSSFTKSLRRSMVVAVVAFMVAALFAPISAQGVAIPYSVQGVVEDVGGNPVPGITVWVEAADGTFYSSSTTDIDGWYRVSWDEGETTGLRVKYSDPSGQYVAAQADEVSVELNVPTDMGVRALEAAGLISGRVLGDMGPLADVTVEAIDPNSYESVASTTTIVDGTFVLGGVLPGSYKLKFTDGAGLYASEYYDSVDSLENATPVDFQPTTPQPIGDVYLQQLGHLLGSVNDTSGAGIAYANVSAIRKAFTATGAEWIWAGETTADDAGSYDLAVPTGIYRLHASSYGFIGRYYMNSEDEENAYNVTLSAGQTRSEFDFALEKASFLSGRVTGLLGAPLQGARIEVLKWVGDEANSVASEIVTNENGEYEAWVREAGSGYYVYCVPETTYSAGYYPNGLPYHDQATTITLTKGGQTTGVNIAMQRGGEVRGNVKNTSGTNLSGMGAVLIDTRTSYRYSGGGAHTDASGNFRITNAELGTYKLQFYDETGRYVQSWYGGTSKSSATTITVGVGSVLTGKNGALSPAGRVGGTVYKPDGKPLADAEVIIHEVSDGGWGEPVASAITNSVGNYMCAGVPAGYVKVSANAGPAYRTGWHDGKDSEATATLVATKVGTTVYGVDVKLLQPGGSISGTVTAGEAGGKPISAPVTLFKAAGAESIWVDETYSSEEDGSYTFTGLADGSYFVYFGDSSTHLPLWYGGSPDQESATPVGITGGNTRAGISVNLGLGGTIEGRIYQFDDQIDPAVRAINVDTGQTHGGILTADSGYRIPHLPAGDYKVVFRDTREIPNVIPSYYLGAILTSEGRVRAAATYDEAQVVTVADGETAFDIDGMLSDTGISTSAEFRNESGDPVKGSMTLWSVGEGHANDVFSRWVDSDANGVAEVSNLAPGQYKLMFWPEDDAYFTYYYPGVATQALSETITIDPMVPTSLGASGVKAQGPSDFLGVFTVPNAARIQGTLKNNAAANSGKGIGGGRANIHVWLDGGENGWMEVYSGYASGVSGAFDFKHLFPGDYKLQIVDSVGTYVENWLGSTTAIEATTQATPPLATTLAHRGINYTRVRLIPSSKTPSYGSSVSLVGQVADFNGQGFRSKSVKIYSGSSSSGPWTYRTTLVTDGSGKTSAYSVRPSGLTYYKLVYGSKSHVIWVKPYVSLSLSAPSSATHNVAFAVSGYLKPRHSAGSYAVKLVAYRYVNGEYVYYKTVSVKVADYSSYSKYSAKIALPYSGKWKLVAVHSDTGHSTTSSTARLITLK